jgi:putative sterol carrier protein
VSEVERPPALDAGQFATLVAQASDEDLARGLSENGEMVLEEIFKRMPKHFRADRAGDLAAVVEWRVRAGEGEPHRWQVVIERGSCRVARDGGAEPTVTFTLGGVDFVRLITGNASGPMLFTFGKLKIRGDLLLAARFQGFFELPRAAR